MLTLPCVAHQEIFDLVTDRPLGAEAADARAAAKRICARCPLLSPCMAAALATTPAATDSIWAGLTPRAREKARTVARKDHAA